MIFSRIFFMPEVVNFHKQYIKTSQSNKQRIKQARRSKTRSAAFGRPEINRDGGFYRFVVDRHSPFVLL